jgi:DNA-binding NtrC family response regulator
MKDECQGGSGGFHASGIVGHSAAMQQVFKLITKVAGSDSTVMITGETGTGKGLVARAVHARSARRHKPFVQINCGAIPENLLESELFGHVRGAFTGANNAKSGKFELACGGTIFLDEIGDMSPDLQVKLLRVLEEREFEPVGGAKTIKADVRVIAATHRDLETEVTEGRFREDLFYRLFVIPLALPALRDRQSDIPLLVAHYLSQFNAEQQQGVTQVSEAAMKMLLTHTWPGNVRELKNVIERLVVTKETHEILPDDLPPAMHAHHLPAAPTMEISSEGINLNSAVSEFEKALIYQSLERTNWVKKRAAQLLQIKRTTLVEKIKRHQLQKCA